MSDPVTVDFPQHRERDTVRLSPFQNDPHPPIRIHGDDFVEVGSIDLTDDGCGPGQGRTAAEVSRTGDRTLLIAAIAMAAALIAWAIWGPG